MKKGVVMEINKRHIILLTQEGEFLRVQKPSSSVEIGEMIYAKPIERNNSQRSRWPAYSALTAILLLSFFLLNPFTSNKTYAYLAVDINPSFEFKIGPDGQVLAINELNAEAAKIVDDILWEEQTLSETIDQIISISDQEGYLNEGDPAILISSVFTDNADDAYIEDLNESIVMLAGKAENSFPKANIVLQEGSMEDYNNAEEQGVSFGRLIQEKTSKKIEQKTNIKKDSNQQNQKVPVNEEKSSNEAEQPNEKTKERSTKKEPEEEPEESEKPDEELTPKKENSRSIPEKHLRENPEKPAPEKNPIEHNTPTKENTIPKNLPKPSQEENKSQVKKQEKKASEMKEKKNESQNKNDHKQKHQHKENEKNNKKEDKEKGEKANKEEHRKNEPRNNGENKGKNGE
ncbi:anti-sigma factor domain-containing protein [Jeotgalibacillus sp. S-D1]|uniref:anti-sigma factor domain-containing protein n=1 Tax=Jeotgalibacillus sp. S-D1 TaxID=2552189 RepID=UPI00105AA78C|nr:anti-sigma factor domain-containing protein [Jeotgalibacillus sp. S-D1]TDL35239.1 anti-sigma factor domain-containing protein [Jeotgalibacillus sp. S-D1]